MNNRLGNNASVNIMGILPTAPATIYAGTNDGRIVKTIDGQQLTKLYDTIASTRVNALAVRRRS
jgi:hypothetical protein